jgi:hypothetical protein
MTGVISERFIRLEISQINLKLDELKERAGNSEVFSKQIDELRGRIKAIERHVGLKTA